MEHFEICPLGYWSGASDSSIRALNVIKLAVASGLLPRPRSVGMRVADWRAEVVIYPDSTEFRETLDALLQPGTHDLRVANVGLSLGED